MTARSAKLKKLVHCRHFRILATHLDQHHISSCPVESQANSEPKGNGFEAQGWQRKTDVFVVGPGSHLQGPDDTTLAQLTSKKHDTCRVL